VSLVPRRLHRFARSVAELTRQATGAPALPRIVFLHIPKTAGSSVNTHFKRHLGSTWSGRAIGLNSAAGIDPARLERARRARFVFGHFGWRTLEAVRGDAFAFTVLRDPAARIVSLYRFARMRDLAAGSGFTPLMEAARGGGFAEFCRSDDPRVRLFIDNAQARTLAAGYLPQECGFQGGAEIVEAAQAHLRSLDFVAFTESLDEDFTALARQAHLPPPRVSLRRNASGGGGPAPAGLEEARAILGERIALDQALYDAARALRQEHGRVRDPA
jgi:hypothetical protein